MILHHVHAAPSAETFTIPPIKALLNLYVGSGKGWVDPFAGNNSPAEWTNDHNPEMPTYDHMDAEEFCKKMTELRHRAPYKDGYPGILFDPPYSYRQITEHYKFMGMKATQLDTSSNFYNRVMNAICDAIRPSGYAISFGWDGNGFGKNRGFYPIEMLIVTHGGHHNATICLVEQKC